MLTDILQAKSSVSTKEACHDSLMELFDRCEMCGKGGTSVKKVIGTFIRLKQSCKSCDHMREWDSQPFLKSIPAGNILSASIVWWWITISITHTSHNDCHAVTHMLVVNTLVNTC